MDYKRIHDEIIENARMRPLCRELGYEKHHIKPRCLGGGNDKSNLVKLTCREHYLIHGVLCKLYPDNSSLAAAYWQMSMKGYHKSSHQYAHARTMFSKSIQGDKNPVHRIADKEKWVENVKAGLNNRPDEVKEIENKRKSEGSLAMWSDPEFKKRMMVARKNVWTPELRARHGKSVSKAKTGMKYKSMSKQGRINIGDSIRGIKRSRVECEICGSSLTANTLKRHQMGANCIATTDED